ncbi:MAG: carboxypeptidase regulatory-like domain-containing protein, partial [Thermoplasmatales archaeon]
WNDWGGYRRYDLPTGEYLLRVTLDSYKSQETQIFIESGEVTSLTFNVEVESLIKNTLNSQILNQLFLLLLNKFNILF